MIQFHNTAVMNFEGALRGMRNPLNSWDKADSCDKGWAYCQEFCTNHSKCGIEWPEQGLYIGPNDLNLAQRLIKAGPDHRKFLRQIIVSVDIIAPLYWWKEFDTYKVATVSNSCSTMHTIHKKEFTLDDFSHEHLTSGGVVSLKNMIERLNLSRNFFIKEKDKSYWWDMIQLLPSSYNQRRTITMNYETLRNIYKSRRNHKLDEWSIGFMGWIDSLPYAEELIKYENS